MLRCFQGFFFCTITIPHCGIAVILKLRCAMFVLLNLRYSVKRSYLRCIYSITTVCIRMMCRTKNCWGNEIDFLAKYYIICRRLPPSSKRHIGHVSHGTLKKYPVVGVSSVMRCCGIQSPHTPPPVKETKTPFLGESHDNLDCERPLVFLIGQSRVCARRKEQGRPLV